MDTLEISTNNLVSLDDQIVGRVHKQDVHPTRNPRPVRFYTGVIGTFDVEHKITEQLYVGSGSDWRINPEFEAAVRKIVTTYQETQKGTN